jgi:hypothetical protein
MDQLVINQSLTYSCAGRTKGLLSGTLAFTSGTGDSDFTGTLQWTKPRQTAGPYPAAIDTTLNVIGSFYNPPGKGGSVLPGVTTGTVELSDTTGVILSATCRLGAGNNLILNNPPGRLKLAITPSTGVFKGTFLYPGQNKPTAFSGVLFQDQSVGQGFFLGPNGGGTVSLTPSP